MRPKPSVTLDDFVAYYGITMRRRKVFRNPNGLSPPGWYHWRCELENPWGSLTVYLSRDRNEPPTVADVLVYLMRVARSIEQHPRFVAWAEAMGLDPERYAVQCLYRIARKETARLRRFLGHTAYQQLLHEIEEP